MSNKKITNVFFILGLVNISNAQVKITNTSNNLINADAILHLESLSSDKGLLLPRVALRTTGEAYPLTLHEKGMVVYNTTTNNIVLGVTPGLYYNDGVSWIRLSKNEKRFGDIKHSYQIVDHNGWYLLNGRTLSSLPTIAQANATALNLIGTLPNASDQLLKNKTSSQSVGALSGANTFSVTQANLPNINFTGNTDTTGSHTHNYLDNPITTQNAAPFTTALNPLANTAETLLTSTSNGDHSHTFNLSLGGSNTSADLKPKSLITNVFIYLGN